MMLIRKLTCDEKPCIITKSNRIMGVLGSTMELNQLAPELERLGVDEVEVLAGEAGAEYLEAQKHTFKALLDLYFGDIETAARDQYLREIEAGKIVFGLKFQDDNKQHIIELLQAHNASNLVAFGMLLNEAIPVDTKVPSH